MGGGCADPGCPAGTGRRTRDADLEPALRPRRLRGRGGGRTRGSRRRPGVGRGGQDRTLERPRRLVRQGQGHTDDQGQGQGDELPRDGRRLGADAHHRHAERTTREARRHQAQRRRRRLLAPECEQSGPEGCSQDRHAQHSRGHGARRGRVAPGSFAGAAAWPPRPPSSRSRLQEGRVAVDAAQFKRALRRWPSGVTIVTSRAGETIHGMTVSAFSSVSLDPPLVMICADKASNTHPVIARGRVFA
ncbi:MAG: flavin reductase family protein, partial [Deltaproteobacteria bacterium]|nr:flavin reductase family protein [Deltaproteobacteria bacterium]